MWPERVSDSLSQRGNWENYEKRADWKSFSLGDKPCLVPAPPSWCGSWSWPWGQWWGWGSPGKDRAPRGLGSHSFSLSFNCNYRLSVSVTVSTRVRKGRGEDKSGGQVQLAGRSDRPEQLERHNHSMRGLSRRGVGWGRLVGKVSGKWLLQRARAPQRHISIISNCLHFVGAERQAGPPRSLGALSFSWQGRCSQNSRTLGAG